MPEEPLLVLDVEDRVSAVKRTVDPEFSAIF
jgi:hypothetical protein